MPQHQISVDIEYWIDTSTAIFSQFKICVAHYMELIGIIFMNGNQWQGLLPENLSCCGWMNVTDAQHKMKCYDDAKEEEVVVNVESWKSNKTKMSSLQGHHDHSFWAVHLIRGSVRGGEGHVLHGQRPTLHHEVDRWGRCVFSTLHCLPPSLLPEETARDAGVFFSKFTLQEKFVHKTKKNQKI